MLPARWIGAPVAGGDNRGFIAGVGFAFGDVLDFVLHRDLGAIVQGHLFCGRLDLWRTDLGP